MSEEKPTYYPASMIQNTLTEQQTEAASKPASVSPVDKLEAIAVRLHQGADVSAFEGVGDSRLTGLVKTLNELREAIGLPDTSGGTITSYEGDAPPYQSLGS